MRAVASSSESDLIRMCGCLNACSDGIRDAIARHDRNCWYGYLELMEVRLRSRNRQRSKILEQIAVVVDPLIRAAAMADAVECLRPLQAAGCVLSDVSEFYGGRPVLLDDAVRSGADRVVAWLLEQRICELDQCGTDGVTPLHAAAKIGRPSTVAVLLARGAFIDPVTPHGRTPLHLAVEFGHVPVVKQLLLAGANPGATALAGETAVMIAARIASWECLELLLEHQSPVLSALPEILRVWGVEKLSHPHLANLRLAQCPRDEIGSLFSAVEPAEARLLLTRGAEPGSAAEHALRHRRHRLLSIIREFGRFPYTEAHFRAATDSRLGMSQLLAEGADPNTWVSRGVDGGERVPLIYYAATEVDTDLQVIPLLLNYGADSTPPPDLNLRPLLCELLNRGRASVPLIQALAALGEGVNARDMHGRTALHAVFEGVWNDKTDELLAALIELGADSNVRDHHGCTPLMIAASKTRGGALTRVQALVDAGADGGVQDADGMNAMHYFFRSTDHLGEEPASLTAAIELLIRAGADPSAKDVGGKYADEVGDQAKIREQRNCIRRIRHRCTWLTQYAVPQPPGGPLLRC